MKNTRIKKLTLKNFKGIKKLIVDAETRDLYVFGDNGSGKTTIADAWRWLLFGKNHEGRHDFAAKPNDISDAERRKMTFSVEAELCISEKDETREMTLKREMREKWVRQEGTKEYNFRGNTNDYYVNKKEVSKAEYDAIIEDNIIAEDIFDLLTDPLKFAHKDKTHWSDRRKLLLQIVDTPSLEELAEKVGCAELASDVGDRSLNEYIKAQEKIMREIDKKLEKITAQLETGAEDFDPKLLEHVETDITNMENSLEKLRQQKADIRAGGKSGQLKNKIQEINAEMVEFKNSWTKDANDKLAVASASLTKLQQEKSDLDNRLSRLKTEIQEKERDKDELARRWKKWSGKNIESCPECEQELPPEQVKLQKNKVAERLKEIKQKGMAAAERAQAIEAQMDKLKQSLTEIQKKTEKQEDKIEQLKVKRQEYVDHDNYQMLANKKAELKSELASGSKAEGQEELDQKILHLKNDIIALRERRAELMAAAAQKENLSQARDEHDKLQEKYEEVAYLRDKAAKAAEMESEILQERANDLFDLAEINLISHTQDGTRKPDCSVAYLGNDFSTNLNNGHQIRVGVDIIKTLSDHFGITVPLIIDNAEGITSVVDTPAQLIYLTVVNEGRWLDKESRKVQAIRSGDRSLYIKKREAKKGVV